MLNATTSGLAAFPVSWRGLAFPVGGANLDAPKPCHMLKVDHKY
jgi:hypothetical protein